MKLKVLWTIPTFIFAFGCAEMNKNTDVSEPQIEASAKEEKETTSAVLNPEEKLWELLYQNKSDESYLKKIENLLHEGVPVDSLNPDGLAPITYAVMENNLELVELLLQNGAEVHEHEEADHELNGKGEHKKNENLLEMAVSQGNYQIVDLLLKMGAHFEIGNESMLAKAVHEEKTELIKLLLHNGYNPNLDIEVEERVFTLLNYAILDGNENTIMLLLDAGANPNFSVEESEGNALVTAVTNEESTELISLLLARGADANARYKEKPLIFQAIQQNNPSLVEAFLVAGALPSSIEESEEAFTLAKGEVGTEVTELLQLYGW